MKKVNLKKLLFVIIGCLALTVFASSCDKKTKPNNGVDNGPHHVDAQFVGKWLWTKGSDGAYYDDNGVYQGAAYGMAIQFKIDADGYGTCFNHVFSTIGKGS